MEYSKGVEDMPPQYVRFQCINYFVLFNRDERTKIFNNIKGKRSNIIIGWISK